MRPSESTDRAPSEARLERLACTSLLLVAVDFDGTLAPIVEEPDRARPDAEAMRALAALARQLHTRVAIVSGRGLRDLDERLGRLEEGILRVGGHGSEFEAGLDRKLEPPHRKLLDGIARAVDLAADGLPGLRVEHKDASSCLHYRQAERADACRALWRLLRQRPDLAVETEAGRLRPKLRRGKKVVELSVLATDKGEALDRLRAELGATAVLYIGDDRTDEDAFARLHEGDLGVKVGGGSSLAKCRVADSAAVAGLLARLAEARRDALRRAASEPIAGLSMLSDRHTAALVTPHGEVAWLCPERFDAPALLASLLGGPTAGRFRVRPAGVLAAAEQRYLDGSLILSSRWPGLELVDWLEPREGEDCCLVRELRPLEPGVTVEIELAPRPDFGRMPAHVEALEDGSLRVESGKLPIRLICRSAGSMPDWEIRREGESDTARARFQLEAPLRLELHCGWNMRPSGGLEAARRWWSARGGSLELSERDLAHAELIERSAIILRGLVYEPSGAMVAAATSSLPESPGGERNWDYRYCWPRDAALACDALVRLGSRSEAERFLDWIIDLDGQEVMRHLQPIYAVDGAAQLPEAELAHLIGYAASQPVRVGNAAAGQLQIDVYGAIAGLLWTFARFGGAVEDRHWRLTERLVDAAAERWQERDSGIWEHRHLLRHHVHSKTMAWVTVDRAIRLASWLGREAPETWLSLRYDIASEVLERGWNEGARAYTVAYGERDLDAAVLEMLRQGLLSPEDPRARSTTLAIARTLGTERGVYRYRFDDGLSGAEGAFHICSAWLIDALWRLGLHQEARRRFDALVASVGPTGLLSEMVDPDSGIALGNTPQAYSHTGLIWCALRLADHERAPGRELE